MFSEPFRQKLKQGKYTGWAAELTEDHLHALLWAVGEFGFRSAGFVERLWENMFKQPGPHERALVALEILADFTSRRPIDFERLCVLVHEGRRRALEAFVEWQKQNGGNPPQGGEASAQSEAAAPGP